MMHAALSPRVDHVPTVTGGIAVGALALAFGSAALAGPDLRIVSVEAMLLGISAVVAGQRCSRIWLCLLLWVGVAFLAGGVVQGVVRGTWPAALFADAAMGGLLLMVHGWVLRGR